MSPVGKGGRYYAGPQHAGRADVASQVIGASGTSAAFSTEDAESLLGKLVVERLGVNEVQKVVIKATGGTFKLTYSGQQTAAIKYNATAAEVRAALEALSNLEPGDVGVTGGPGNETGSAPYVITFSMGADVAQLTAQTTLTGGEAKAEVSTTTAGTAAGTLKVQLETEVNGDWYVVGEFPEVTAADPSVGKAFGPLGTNCRWKWTLGATDGAKFSIIVSEQR